MPERAPSFRMNPGIVPLVRYAENLLNSPIALYADQWERVRRLWSILLGQGEARPVRKKVANHTDPVRGSVQQLLLPETPNVLTVCLQYGEAT